MKRLLCLLLLGALPAGAALPLLKVSENQRFLVTETGAPFFWLGDTAWELFHRATREEAEFYLKNRAAKQFTVIQAVALAEFDGLTAPNAYGHTPLKDNDPTQPNEEYFQHVDWIVNKAGSLGLYVGLLPTWGDKWNKKWGQGPVIFTPQNAALYGEWLGKRYRDKAIIWILGGDRPVENEGHKAIIRAMAKGLRAGDGGRHLITFHPCGGRGSAEWFHEDEWLTFNLRQNGHVAEFSRYAFVYAPVGRSFSVRFDKLVGSTLRAWWFDPRTGAATRIGDYPKEGTREFTPPQPGEELDWVLVLDDVAQNFPPPGQPAPADNQRP
jgi:hypothetical protein